MGSKANNKIGKAIIDIAMIVGLLACAVSSSVFEEGKHALRSGAAAKMFLNGEHLIASFQ